MNPKHPGSIKLEEHIYHYPPFPDDINEILFLNEPVENQYWRRQTDFPEEFYGYGPLTKVNYEFTQWEEVDGTSTVINLSKEDTEKIRVLRDRELKRRKEGVWFMNNGKPTYMTGDHYFCLQWCPIADIGTYGSFRWFQAKFFYFLEVCGISYACDPHLRLSPNRPNCTGGYIVKPKKTGVTLLLMYAFVNRVTMTAALNTGAMSNNGGNCLLTNMAYFKYALDNLPYIFLPNMETDNQDFIKFGAPRAKNTGTKKSQMKQMGNGKGLNSFFKAAATKADAFDGPVMHLENLDEFAKCKDPYPAAILEKTIQTVKIGGLPNGLLFLSHYTPEIDDESFEQARKIYFDSELTTQDPVTGMTTSELYAYCISAQDSYATKDNPFDKYGFIDEDKALRNIKDRREQLKSDRQKLQSFIRQYPLNREEAWRQGGGGGSTFDNVRLGIRKSEVEDALRHGNLPYVEGKLEWVGQKYEYNEFADKSTASEVRFLSLTDHQRSEGVSLPFRIYHVKQLYHPLVQDSGFNSIVKRNIRHEDGKYMPANDTPFIAASDPTEYTLKSDVQVGSKNAITVFNFPDIAQDTYHGKKCTGRMAARYLYRPENPKEYLEALIKVVFYFGCYVIIEANKRWVITEFKLMGLEHFLLVIDANGSIVPYNGTMHQKLPETTKNVIDNYCRYFEVYISKKEDGTSDLDMVEDEEWISQAMKFKSEDTKKYDLFVCAAYNLMAMDSFLAYKLRMDNENTVTDGDIFQTVAHKLID